MADLPLSVQVSSLQSIIPLRFAILRPNEADTSSCDYAGDRDPSAVHLRLMRAGSAIGMASILPDFRGFSDRVAAVARVRGLGVLPGHQGTGLGRILLKRTLEIAAERELLPLWGSGRSHLGDFYHSVGADTISDPYVISGTGDHLDFYLRAYRPESSRRGNDA